MKQLLDIIQEKLVINKNTKLKYCPDLLNNDDILLYDDYDEEKDHDIEWEKCNNTLDKINKNYTGFIISRFNSISDSKDLEKDIIGCENDLMNIVFDTIITGKDLGYRVKLSHGHIEIDCLNSGSKATYYVYALSNEAYDKIEMWFDGDEDEVDNLDFLLIEGNVVEIIL